MKVAAIQVRSQDNVSDNLRMTDVIVAQAAHAGAKTVLLPEAFAYLGDDSEKSRLAEELGAGGEVQDAVSSWAKKYGVNIIAGGMIEKSEEQGRPHNTSAVFDASGALVERYRKLHLFDVELSDGTFWAESKTTCGGQEPKNVTLGEVTFGLSICYDLRFPELYAWQRQHGAQVLTVPAAFTKTTGRAHWHPLLQARAIENQCWLMAAAQEGAHPGGRKTFGHAMIIDPWGRVVAEVTEPGPGYALADIDLKEIDAVRAQMPVENHRKLAAWRE